MQRDEPIATDLPADRRGAARRRLPRWLRRALPGALAALLFGALALGGGVLGAAAGPLQGLLALALAAAVAAQPSARPALRRLAAWPELPHAALVLAVTLLALFLRTWGLRFGLPYLDHPDEWAVADEAVRMLQTGDYRPVKWDYPTLVIYLQVGVAAAHFLWGAGAGLYRDLSDLSPEHYYVWMRALTAALGTGGVLLTYAIGRMLYGRAAGLAAAALLAVLPVAAGDSHYVTTDTPAMFFALLAFLLIARLGLGAEQPAAGDGSPAGGRWPLYAGALLAGLATGLAAAAKYTVAVLVAPLALAVVFAARRWADGQEVAPARVSWLGLGAVAGLWSALGVAIGFTLGVPLWLAELRGLLDGLASIVVHYRFTGHPGAESSRPALFYWGALVNEGLLPALAMLGGLVLAFVRRTKADVLVLAFVVPAVLQLTGVKVVFFRNAVPLLPFLCILAGAALVAALGLRRAGPAQSDGAAGRWSRIRGRAGLLAAAVALIAAQPLAKALHDELLRARPTTRVLATEWVERNAPDGARIWLEDGTLILSGRLRVLGGAPVTTHDPAWYRENGFSFLVANLDRDDKDRARLAELGEPLVRFERGGERHGPTLAIYGTGAGDVAQEPRTRLGATLGSGALALEGYRHPGEVRAGEVLPLALYWQPARPLPQDYVVYVHLVDANGAKVAQRDTQPLEGSFPTSRWQPGALIRDDQDLPVPADVPPGTYRLLVGMYDGATLAAINDAGPIDLGEVVVTR
ncbi:MAG: phospholipid carrier-dependent glycosyltransferase [Chloroflexota bacterium]